MGSEMCIRDRANLGATLLGVLYVAVPLSLLLYVPVLAGDGVWRPETVLCYIFIIWANDVFAYLVGMTFGRHRLCERLSPKKSWRDSSAASRAERLEPSSTEHLTSSCFSR